MAESFPGGRCRILPSNADPGIPARSLPATEPAARHRCDKVPYNDQIVWASVATLTGLPATAAPIGRTDDGLPIGVQINGGYLEDRTTIAFAGLIEREYGGFTPPPI